MPRAASIVFTSLVLVAAPLASQTSPRPSRARNATLLSVFSTVVPMAAGVTVAALGSGGTGQTAAFTTLFWGGALVGPSVGYFWGGAGSRTIKGLAIRGGTFLLASILAPTEDWNDGIYPNPDTDRLGVWALAAIPIVVSATIDIVRVHDAVEAEESLRVSLAPLIDPRHRRLGAALQLRW